jgi:hypothetical protein
VYEQALSERMFTSGLSIAVSGLESINWGQCDPPRRPFSPDPTLASLHSVPGPSCGPSGPVHDRQPYEVAVEAMRCSNSLKQNTPRHAPLAPPPQSVVALQAAAACTPSPAPLELRTARLLCVFVVLGGVGVWGCGAVENLPELHKPVPGSLTTVTSVASSLGSSLSFLASTAANGGSGKVCDLESFLVLASAAASDLRLAASSSCSACAKLCTAAVRANPIGPAATPVTPAVRCSE